MKHPTNRAERLRLKQKKERYDFVKKHSDEEDFEQKEIIRHFRDINKPEDFS